MENKKYIFVTGGVCSSLGKGLTASTIAALIEACGYSTNIGKIDPYINVDAGTMGPLQHGETYVTADGAETDLDLGNYERFTERPTSRASSITTGHIYQTVINNERRGDYLGKCVQVVPHITDEIKRRITALALPETEVVIIEIGGTVGDIEGKPFYEAIRQLLAEKSNDLLCVHLTLIPQLPGSREIKTKPTQHSVQKLRELGIQPTILVCRTEVPLSPSMRDKISLHTQVEKKAIIEAFNFKHSSYELPLLYHQQGLTEVLFEKLGLTPKCQDLQRWKTLYDAITQRTHSVRIAMVGKYTDLPDAYKSVYEALEHAGIHHKTTIDVKLIDSETVNEDNVAEKLAKVDALLIPGGFGKRGIPGKITVLRYAREKKLPYLGLCLGMQVMVIEYARNVAGLSGAHSTEFDPDTPHPVISLLGTQKEIQEKGGTMRLGAQPVMIMPGTLLEKAYKRSFIEERHRHRYEVNNDYLKPLWDKELILGATHEKNKLVEGVVWPHHPWGIGVQFHPELQSTPFHPHPLFVDFVAAAIKGQTDH